MGALLGVPQHNTAELYTQASNQGQLTEGECLCLMTWCTCQNIFEILCLFTFCPDSVKVTESSWKCVTTLVKKKFCESKQYFTSHLFVLHRLSAASADDPPDLSQSGERILAAWGGGLSAGQWEGGKQQWKCAQRQRVPPLQEEDWMKILNFRFFLLFFQDVPPSLLWTLTKDCIYLRCVCVCVCVCASYLRTWVVFMFTSEPFILMKSCLHVVVPHAVRNSVTFVIWSHKMFFIEFCLFYTECFF